MSLDRPLVISVPEPRSLPLIFRPEQQARLFERYRIVEVSETEFAQLDDTMLAQARYIVGQPPISTAQLAKLSQLRCVFNVESNLLDNMPYAEVFARGIHVVTTGGVFALPVAELGLGLALDLLRGITDADLAFRQGKELWGGDGNGQARLLSRADVGIVGFGELGKAMRQVLSGFTPTIRVYDPWLPPSLLIDQGVVPASLEDVLGLSDVVFVVAAVTSENQGFLGAESFGQMREGACFILLSRAGVVDFAALMAAVEQGRIRAATDVFPEEPVHTDDPIRTLPGLLRSAHRAGALDEAFKRMGDMVLEDMELLDKGLPPMRCRRAERETVQRMRSKPVTRN